MESSYCDKIRGRLYGLLCEREKGNSTWEKFLDTILIELYGFSETERTINYYPLLAKVSMLRYLDYEYFRKTIFECINLVGGIKNE